jgi:hypothetical protein
VIVGIAVIPDDEVITDANEFRNWLFELNDLPADDASAPAM